MNDVLDQSPQKARLIGYVGLADDDRAEKWHDALLTVLEDQVPVVEETETRSAYIDVSGMDRLYKQPKMLLQSLVVSLRKAIPVEIKLALAPSKFVAYVAADLSDVRRPWVIAVHQVRSFLSSQPITYLPIQDDLKERFAFLGLDTLGKIADLNPQALEARFGPEGRLAWELACGIDERPVIARRLFRPISETLVFPAPVVDWAAFWVGVRHLLGQVWKRKERGEKTVRQLRLIARIDEELWDRLITLHEPIGDCDRLEMLLRRRLEAVQLPGAVSSLTLQLTALGPLYAGQESLFPGSSQRMKRIREALAGIIARDGSSGLYRVAEVEPWSRIPERRYALISFDL